MVPLSAKPSAAKVLDSKNSSRDPEGYHVIGLLNRRIWTIRWQNSLYFGLLLSLARSSCVWYHVIFSRSRDEIDQHVHDKAIISVSCKRHIRNSTGIFRLRLEFSTQIILPSTIFQDQLCWKFCSPTCPLRESERKKNCIRIRTSKGKDSEHSQLSLEIGSALSP